MLPTVHYNMGGVPTNYHGEVVTVKDGDPDAVVPGLMAVARRPASRSTAPTGWARTRCSTSSSSAAPPRKRRARSSSRRATHKPLADAGQRQEALDRLDRLRHAKGARRRRPIRLEMQRTMQDNAAVFRTGEVPWRRASSEMLADVWAKRSDVKGRRPLDGLELRPRRDAGARQSDAPGGRHHGTRPPTARKAAAPMRARTSRTATTTTG